MNKIFRKNLSLVLTVLLTVLLLPAVAYASGDADTIYYSVDAGDTVAFDGYDFNDVCDDWMDEDLDYVIFELPDSDDGTLFYDYDGDEESYVDDSDEYYYDDDPDLSDVSFEAENDCSSTVTIEYTGYDTGGNSYTGEIEITVDSDLGTADDIEYEVDPDDTLAFDGDDFNDVCTDLNDDDADLDYIYFELPDSDEGTLYFDYDGDDEEAVDDSDEYYYDDDPDISDVTFVPEEDFTGTVTIGYVGYDTDGYSFSGDIVIEVEDADDDSDLDTADTIYFTGYTGSEIPFLSSYFNNKCEDLTDSTLSYVKFTLPSSAYGTLYYDYVSEDSYTSVVSASTKYYYEDSYPYLSEVSFVPAGSEAGAVTLTYTGYGEDGSSFKGYVEITYMAKAVSTSTSKSSSAYFNDVNGSYGWAADYVDSLYAAGILTGETTADNTRVFRPSDGITRGDFLLILSRTFNFQTGTSKDNFSDVKAGAYYYDAVAAAKAVGIAQGSGNQFYPEASITREDAMVLVLRAMNTAGLSVTAGTSSELTAFADNSAISDYAREAVATLVKSGVITGNDENRILPVSNITRAEAAAVIYRIKN